jgi:hypothetical protein
MGVEQKIDMSKLEIKWNYVKDLKEALNDDTRFKQLRLTTMFNFGFQIQGVKSMTNRQMFDMCIRALFISHKERNRPKMKGIKWVDRW